MAPKKRKNGPPPARAHEPEIVRIPLNRAVHLAVDSLTVILGASLIAPAEMDPNDTPHGFNVEVAVDGEPFLIAGMRTIVMEVDEPPTYWRDEDTDPVIITPREDGVEVSVALRTKSGRMLTPPKGLRGAEVWVRVAR